MDHDQLASLIESLLAAESDDQRREALALVDLDATERAMVDAANAILDGSDQDAETLETLQSLVDALEFIRTERGRRGEAAAEQAETLAAISARVNGETETPDAEQAAADTTDTTATAEPETPEPETLAAETETPAEPETPTEPTPAPAPRPSLQVLRRAAPADTQPTAETDTSKMKVLAAMDVPGFPIGKSFRDRAEIAKAVISRQEALGRGGDSVRMEKIPVVKFDYLDELRQVSGDTMLNGLILAQAGQPNALTASGGFCAPKQTIYDFVKVSAPDDLVQDFLPTVGAERGSIEYPDSPDIRDAFSATLSRAYTNQNDIDSVNKVTAVIACPTFNTCTVGAQYVILQFGNLATRAYPEWVEHWVSLAMDTHAHKVSEKLVGQMVALSNAAITVGPNAGATSTLISNLSLAAADLRQDLRMGRNAPLEIMLPSWAPELVRGDLARASKGGLETLAVTDAQVAGWFAARNLNPHYVVDWQNISANSATGASVWPAGISWMLYPPGTFVRLDMGTLDLGVVRDSVLNKTNDYNIFVETFESVCKPGIESRIYTSAICANGAFSADQNLGCSGLDIPGS